MNANVAVVKARNDDLEEGIKMPEVIKSVQILDIFWRQRRWNLVIDKM